ncbi:MAG: hypothetical protein LIO45_01685 [Clostridiales bacterium]|nr:hypothetical protein [Clostridiales bacterium]
MYNRYSPPNGYQPVEPDGPQREQPRPSSGGNAGSGSPFFSLRSLLGGNRPGEGGIDGLLERLGISRLDKGDILLILILIYLFRESEDDEWLIILALVLLMGLG